MMNPEVQKILRERSRTLNPSNGSVHERWWDPELKVDMYAVFLDGYLILETGNRDEWHTVNTDAKVQQVLLKAAKDSGVEPDPIMAQWVKDRSAQLNPKGLPPVPAEEVQQSPVQ